MMRKKLKKAAKTAVIAGAACAAADAFAAGLSFWRIMTRNGKDFDSIKKMTGTDWERYQDSIEDGIAQLLERKHEWVEIDSDDGLKLRGIYFPCGDTDGGRSGKAALCVHGYSSTGLIDYALIAHYYLKMGMDVLIIDNRAHGRSEGRYVGFGYMDRFDIKRWIKFLIGREGEDCQILLHGISMGGTAVLMASGTPLPRQVKLIVSDCAFSSAYAELSSVIQKRFHLPPAALMPALNLLTRIFAGYWLSDCNACKEVRKSRTPTLFMHGSRDSFVPLPMAYELFEACAAPKEIFIINGSSHAEDYYKDPASYEREIQKMTEIYMD